VGKGYHLRPRIRYPWAACFRHQTNIPASQGRGQKRAILRFFGVFAEFYHFQLWQWARVLGRFNEMPGGFGALNNKIIQLPKFPRRRMHREH